MAECSNPDVKMFLTVLALSFASSVAGLSSPQVSLASTTPTAPGPPRIVKTTPADGSASITWTTPKSDGGSPILGYVVTSVPSGASCRTRTHSCQFVGLVNGTKYSLSVSARNVVGTGSSVVAEVLPSRVPDRPTSVAAAAGVKEAYVWWIAPAFDGGTKIVSYTATSSPGGKSCTSTRAPCRITGLSIGTSYRFSVVARNIDGPSSPSKASVSVVTGYHPSQPTSVVISPGDALLHVSWNAPNTDALAIDHYEVDAAPGVHYCTTSPTVPSDSCDITGLLNGSTYSVAVFAIMGDGSYTYSNTVGGNMPVGVPSPPSDVTATAGSASAAVSWAASSANGSAVAQYVVTASPGGSTCTTSTLSCVVPSLTNGVAYTFTVVSTNGIGRSSPSLPSAIAIPADIPGAPVNVIASGTVRSATVSWNAPANDGGSPIQSYLVTASPGGSTCSTTSLSCSVPNLISGSIYTFTVVASNSAWSSEPSSPSTPVLIPQSAPDPPTNVTAIAADSSATVHWVAPKVTGGLAITNYTVTSTPSSLTCTTASLSCVVTGLANGTQYTFTVVATNSIGTSDPSVPSAGQLVGTTPGPPRTPSVIAGLQLSVITWTPPASDGGSTITEYAVIASKGGGSCTSTQTTGFISCTIYDLMPGTYTYQIAAKNSFGWSTPVSYYSATARVQPISQNPPAPENVRSNWMDVQHDAIWVAWQTGGPSSSYSAVLSASDSGPVIASCTIPDQPSDSGWLGCQMFVDARWYDYPGLQVYVMSSFNGNHYFSYSVSPDDYFP